MTHAPLPPKGMHVSVCVHVFWCTCPHVYVGAEVEFRVFSSHALYPNFNFIYLFLHLYVCVSVLACARDYGGQKKGVRSPGGTKAGDCELPNVDGGKPPLGLCKNCTCFQLFSHLSSPSTLIFETRTSTEPGVCWFIWTGQQAPKIYFSPSCIAGVMVSYHYAQLLNECGASEPGPHACTTVLSSWLLLSIGSSSLRETRTYKEFICFNVF